MNAVLLALCFAPRGAGAQLGLPLPLPPAAAADTATPAAARLHWYFHHPEATVGSAALRTPVETFLTRGFSNLILENQERAPLRIDWGKGWRTVSTSFRHPREAIERFGGWDAWVSSQLLPDGGRVWQWAWAPNYGGHLIAGGITYRYFAEWMDDHGVPKPRATAAAVYMLDMVVNEMVEAQVSDHTGQASALADLVIFDPLGILLFSFDGPARFFAGTLEAADWSPQVAVTLPLGRLENSAQVLAYKVPLPFTGDHLRYILLLGMGAQSGLQVRLDNGLHGAGVIGFETERRYVDAQGREHIDAAWQGGFYLDRNNSLLASLVYSEKFHSRWQLNVYPGVLPAPLQGTGLYLVADRNNRVSFGAAFRRTYGVGLGWNDIRNRP